MQRQSYQVKIVLEQKGARKKTFPAFKDSLINPLSRSPNVFTGLPVRQSFTGKTFCWFKGGNLPLKCTNFQLCIIWPPSDNWFESMRSSSSLHKYCLSCQKLRIKWIENEISLVAKVCTIAHLSLATSEIFGLGSVRRADWTQAKIYDLSGIWFDISGEVARHSWRRTSVWWVVRSVGSLALSWNRQRESILLSGHVNALNWGTLYPSILTERHRAF